MGSVAIDCGVEFFSPEKEFFALIVNMDFTSGIILTLYTQK